MKVYVVTRKTPNMPNEVIGVFDTDDKARRFKTGDHKVDADRSYYIDKFNLNDR